jgi:type IV pilus assembly protein PilA
MRHARGFTLIELMVVVAIIAILSVIAISVYMDSTSKSELSEAFTIIDGLKTDVSDYYNQTGSCPTFGSDNLSAAASYTGEYVGNLAINSVTSGCSVIATMRNNTVSPSLHGKTVTFVMTNNGGTVSWQCSSNANPIFVPMACQ